MPQSELWPIDRVFRPGTVHGRGFVRRALDAIAAVHDLPRVTEVRIDVVTFPTPTQHGRFVEGRIEVNRRSPAAELTVVHEVGHTIDRRVLGGNDRLGASEQGDGRLAEWHAAVEASEAIRRLRAIYAIAPARSALAGFLNYALRPEELFARSYAQWIAERSGSTVLLVQVAAQCALTDPINPLLQWQEADARPIAEALDRLMERLGWTHTRGSR